MSSPLVALLLVTSSSRGSHVVFQWPRRPKLVKRYSRMRYFAEEEELEDDLLAAGATHPEYLDASDSDSGGDSDESDCVSSEASFTQGAALFGHDDDERAPRDTAPPPAPRRARRQRAAALVGAQPQHVAPAGRAYVPRRGRGEAPALVHDVPRL